ncbi:unnamed protein product [Vitrella brassicaformis CCMP3155]|uniref:AraC effector-binding domain-containing protein n=1 Tax=Vitrella brassicaformis (strain CCMP3155) TaxID=1169540 RepID=A0A0G4G5P6_VITBC|nr:unnamed protein product [Vitrella brassicaformis CCMP3155]|mmetsp:Transcript_24307/g.70087  ORF Transcript_24307/g.70087 Transcript_24307/m.70087 type:complete len:166 (-) Transcript_24307:326-823(-)|eukprot:CEM23389.1 unnamed protein product [Vitrella brassicaformis CCMP3155]
MSSVAAPFVVSSTEARRLIAIQGGRVTDDSQWSKLIPPLIETLCGKISEASLWPKVSGPLMNLMESGDISAKDCSDMKWWIAYPVDETAEAPEGTELIELPALKCAKWTYTGPYSGLAEMWEASVNQLMDDGHLKMGKCMAEEYIDDPCKTPEDKLRTLIWIQIE